MRALPVVPEQLDPSIIDFAPTEPDRQDFDADQSAYYVFLTGELAAENASLQAELDKLRGKKTYDDVRASMMQPYADKVFWFLVWYCLFVAALILMKGFKLFGFDISDTVTGIIAGSTAVSAIGLVGFVVSGLFGAKKDNSTG